MSHKRSGYFFRAAHLFEHDLERFSDLGGFIQVSAQVGFDALADGLRCADVWLDTFRHLHPHAEGSTHELRWPWGGLIRRSRLDYIFFHPGETRWKVLEARHLQAEGAPHSDHHAVLARLVPGGESGGIKG